MCTERNIGKAAAKLTYAFANATVPKVNVIAGEAFGSAYVVMNSKGIGADLVYAWSDAKIGMMDASLAAKVMYAGADAATQQEKAAEYAALQDSVDAAAARGYVDTVIDAQVPESMSSARLRCYLPRERTVRRRNTELSKRSESMKRSLKKLSALLLLMGLFVLTGCAAKETLPNEEVYQGKLDSYVEMLVGTDKESLDANLSNLQENYDDFEQQVALYPYIGGTGQKFDFTADAYLSLLKSYDANYDEFGDFVGLKEYEGGTTDKDGNVTYTAVYEFTGHNMRLALEFDKDNVVTTVTMDPIYSKGEIAEKAALNTLIGMGSVFAVLILLAFIISLFKYVSVFENRGKAKKDAVEKAARPHLLLWHLRHLHRQTICSLSQSSPRQLRRQRVRLQMAL